MARILFIAGNSRSLIANRGNLIRSMQAAGHEVQALVPTYDLLPDLDQFGITWHGVQFRRTGLNPTKEVASIRDLYRHIKRIQPDKVFAYTIKPIVYGVPAARWAGVPEVYAMVTGLGYLFTGEKLRQRILRLIAVLLYRLALGSTKAVFFQNPDDRSLLARYGAVRSDTNVVMVNGSGVDLEFFANRKLPSKPITFLSIARLLEDKGLIEFVNAAAIVKAQHPEVRFVILGPHDATLPRAISLGELQRWRSEGHVELVDAVPDVRMHLAACHVFVLASYREGTPRSVLEAMSMGRPIITTDAPGCRETVKHGHNGLLVEPKRIEPLVAAMRRFIVEPDLIRTMGEKSRELAVEKYDVVKVNRKIMEAMGLA